MSFWRRHRRKLITAAAVGAAGAAAAYYWWYSSEEEERRRRQQEELRAYQLLLASQQQQQQQRQTLQQLGGGGSAGAAAPAAGEGGEDGPAAEGLEGSLASHFASIQELSDRQALEQLLPRLAAQLAAATDYEPLRASLRSGSGLPPEEKLALWRGLAGHSFSRALGAVWLVPLLDLLVRLKLHIVGRHMYLESKLPQLAPPGGLGGGAGGLLGHPGGGFGRLALPPVLSDRAKEEFFRCDYFIDVGAAGLLHKLAAAVERSLSGVDYGGSMSTQDVEALVITCHASFEDDFGRADDLWAAYLVPPGPAPVSVRTGSGVEALLSPVEAAMVDELNAELRAALGDYRFVEALRAAVRHTSKGMGAYVTSKMGGSSTSSSSSSAAQQHGGDAGSAPSSPFANASGADGGGSSSSSSSSQQQQQQQQQGGPRPFPYVVPIVAKSAQLLFDETGRCTKGISGLREVQALCAFVFTFGPNIA